MTIPAILITAALAGALIAYLTRNRTPPDPAQLGRTAAHAAHPMDIALVHLTPQGPIVTCSCDGDDNVTLYNGTLADCQTFTRAYNREIFR